jgi:hypothetical protein
MNMYVKHIVTLYCQLLVLFKSIWNIFAPSKKIEEQSEHQYDFNHIYV